MKNQKGGDFERTMCRFISLWWTEQKSPDVFWRNQNRKMQRNVTRYQLGDIKAEEPQGRPLIELFNIEFKCGYSRTKKGKRVKNIPWDLLDLIDGKGDIEKKTVMKFWEQTRRDAAISDRMPLLIFKRDYHTPTIALCKEDMEAISDYAGKYEKIFLAFRSEELNLYFLSLKDFCDWAHPAALLCMWKDRLQNNKQAKIMFNAIETAHI